MGRRIEVELTSSRDDGTWTWRAAGARQPKGVVDADLLYEGASVGDIVRAEADFEIEGISITAVLPPRQKKREEPARLEVIGPPREHQGVTSSLVAKSDRPRSGRDRDGRDGREGRPRRDGPGDRRGGPPRAREGGPPGAAPRPEGGRSGADGRPRGDRARTEGRREPRRPRPEGARPDDRQRRPAGQPAEPAAPKAKRLTPANVHRAAVVAGLPPEEQPVAEQLLRGGIPAVRQAIEAQNARLRGEGQPEVKADPLVALAEQLLPRLKAAEWRDRAEAAAKIVDEVSLRDLRSVVTGADAARDDEGRLLADTLRQALERRVNEHRERWVADIGTALDEGRLVRALRLSAHPPDPSSRFPAELAVRLGDAAGAAMAPDTTPDRWVTLLDAVGESPVRRSVRPAGLPAEPGEELLQAARQASGKVPALAGLLGIAMPPPPGPPRAARGRPAGAPAGRRPPPPPPSVPSPADRAATEEPAARAEGSGAARPASGETAPTAATDGTADAAAAGPVDVARAVPTPVVQGSDAPDGHAGAEAGAAEVGAVTPTAPAVGEEPVAVDSAAQPGDAASAPPLDRPDPPAEDAAPAPIPPSPGPSRAAGPAPGDDATAARTE